MKVSSLLKILEGKSPNEDICALLWFKDDMDYPTDDEHTLKDEAWAEICKEFDEWEDAGNDVSEWIADAVVEKSEYSVIIWSSPDGEEKTGFTVDMWDGRSDAEKNEHK